ncbi:hypothetical protein [Rhodococcus opacus]|uniref:hypothetical protein n=1 Tax=Rhodococcus opacus TaxID=37919 RepID=UPI002952A712|nr:hypothetical protein [Rhodococcus opacus]MDV7088990.1 hypothetical protein [Rhodococcus opacus]
MVLVKNRLWFELNGARASAAFDQDNPEQIWIGRFAESSLVVRDPAVGSEEQRRLSVLPAGHAQGYGTIVSTGSMPIQVR